MRLLCAYRWRHNTTAALATEDVSGIFSREVTFVYKMRCQKRERLDFYSREHYNDFIDFLLLRFTIKSSENHISFSPRHQRLLASDDDDDDREGRREGGM